MSTNPTPDKGTRNVSIERAFMPPTTDIAQLARTLRRCKGVGESIPALAGVSFDTALDTMRAVMLEMALKGDGTQALGLLEEMASYIDSLPQPRQGELADINAMLRCVATSLCLRQGDYERGAVWAAKALEMLVQTPKRKDPAFLAMLASLLYDIATLHTARNQYRQAEREIEKCVKILERLAKADPGRYAPGHLMAMGRTTEVYRSRVRQAELLAHYQAATTAYLEQLGAGSQDAATHLVEALGHQGDTLADMGRQREAMQYYTKALKYLTRMEADFTLRQLQLSIALGETMLAVGESMRDKGVHLLNTMLHKATKINALEEHRRIVDILLHAKSRQLDLLGLWHKAFPR